MFNNGVLFALFEFCMGGYSWSWKSGLRISCLGVLFQECLHALILNLVESHICGDKGFDQINIEDVVRAGVHGDEGEELLSCLLSFNIEPHVVFVPKRLHMLLKDAFAVHFGTKGAELTNQLLGFRQ